MSCFIIFFRGHVTCTTQLPPSQAFDHIKAASIRNDERWRYSLPTLGGNEQLRMTLVQLMVTCLKQCRFLWHDLYFHEIGLGFESGYPGTPRSNPFHKGIPNIQTSGPQTNNLPLAEWWWPENLNTLRKKKKANKNAHIWIQVWWCEVCINHQSLTLGGFF